MLWDSGRDSSGGEYDGGNNYDYNFSRENTGYGANHNSGNVGSGEGSGGGSRGGGGFAGSIGYTAHGISNSTSYYGAWYEGEQLNDYYHKQAELTYREKQAVIRRTENQISQIRQQTVDAERDVVTAQRFGEIKEKRYREQTDGAIASVMAKGAASGVDISYGSPMDFLNKVIDDRAFDYELLKWENENEVYQREKVVGTLKDKATIMLDESKIAQDNYDYQSALYKRAAGDARRAARYKSYQAGLSVG